MSQTATIQSSFTPITWRKAGLLALIAVVCFHAAYTPARSGFLAFAIIGYVICLVQLARLRTTRQCFYVALTVGFACYAPQLNFFWNIFGPAAIVLWLVLALWLAMFVVLTHLAMVRVGLRSAALLVPFIWTGLEYFRSELYYLKFSWLNVGYAFAETSSMPLHLIGVYGLGFMFAAWGTLFLVYRARHILLVTATAIFVLFAFTFLLLPTAKLKNPAPNLRMAGAQLEFPNSSQVLQALDRIVAADQKLVANHTGNRPLTNINLILLPEYTLDGPSTEALQDWCRTNQKFLIVGGKQPLGDTNYYNTAFVIGTNGEVVFKQVKSVPIQFFMDGLPAPEQKVWDSPWGKIGICICYDLSYTRVTDELVKQGAQMLIVPTMDVTDWGQHQHELHARIAPVRAAEYGIPIFRVASSGISQGVSRAGVVQSHAPFPGEGELISFGARLTPGQSGSWPLDRWLAPVSVLITAVFILYLMSGIPQARREMAKS